MDDGMHGAGVSRGVKSQMGHILNRVRQKSGSYDEAELGESDLSELESLPYYEDDDEYLDQPLKGQWEVRYDNQNYIRSMVHEDKGLHHVAHYPKHKWQVSYGDHPDVRNLEPYPARVSIDHGDDDVPQWDIPYDNRNYVLSMLAGSGVSKMWEEGLLDPEAANERLGNLRNPYDYIPEGEDEVIHCTHRDMKPRRESYRFNRVERNVHDYETDSVPEDEITRPHPRQQRRRSTNIYRYGDVERNVHDYADGMYSRSPRYDTAAQEPRTHFDAINKWKRATQSSDHEAEAQNAYNEELEKHYNQYGVEVSSHDYDENRAIRSAETRKRIVPMSFVNIMKHENNRNRSLNQPIPFVNVMRKHENKKNRSLKQVAESYRDRLHHTVPVQRDLYERVAEDYDDHDDYIQAPGMLYEDILEEHKNHPYDYGTTHEDSYQEYMEDEGSQTWMSTNEKYSEIHHRSE